MTERVAKINEIDICYETFGDREARPLLLVMGLGGQMIWWDDDFCRQLTERGFFVIRFDNRDAGHSSRVAGRSHPVKAYVLRSSPYTLEDMADDAAGLLEALAVPSAHVVGVSMGGMIAQLLAIRHPSRVRSLTSIMSTTGGRLVGWTSLRASLAMLSRRPADRDGSIESMVRMFRMIRSPAYSFDEARMRTRAERTFDRGINPSGVARHLAACLAARDRSPQLRKLRIPALVIHGTADPLVHVSGGRATAEAIPGAELDLVAGMGHDLPRDLWPRVVDGIARTAARAEVSPAAAPEERRVRLDGAVAKASATPDEN